MAIETIVLFLSPLVRVDSVHALPLNCAMLFVSAVNSKP